MIGQDKVAVAISGGYSLPTRRGGAGCFQKAGIPYFAAYAVHPDVPPGGNWAFRGVTLGPPQGAITAKFRRRRVRQEARLHDHHGQRLRPVDRRRLSRRARRSSA